MITETWHASDTIKEKKYGWDFKILASNLFW